MLRDITLCQYYTEDSFIHKLDPRFKIFAVVLYSASIFMSNTIILYGINFIFLAIIVSTSKVPISFILRGLKPIFILLIFTFLINLFARDGITIFKYSFLRITDSGIIYAFYMLFRISFMIIGTSLLTYTTTPVKLTEGFEKIFNHLKFIKFPAHEISLMMSITLRFIPVLLGEINKIIKAQSSRGVDFDNGNIIKKIKNLIPILIPLLVRAFTISSVLAEAMESRCYIGDVNRGKFKTLKYSLNDLKAFLTMIIYIGILAYLRFFFAGNILI